MKLPLEILIFWKFRDLIHQQWLCESVKGSRITSMQVCLLLWCTWMHADRWGIIMTYQCGYKKRGLNRHRQCVKHKEKITQWLSPFVFNLTCVLLSPCFFSTLPFSTFWSTQLVLSTCCPYLSSRSSSFLPLLSPFITFSTLVSLPPPLVLLLSRFVSWRQLAKRWTF